MNICILFRCWREWLGEQLLSDSHGEHCILLIAGVFRYDGPTHLGIDRAIDGAIKDKLPIQIGSGRALRNYVYITNVAHAILYGI